jgi:hypothetical protein
MKRIWLAAIVPLLLVSAARAERFYGLGLASQGSTLAYVYERYEDSQRFAASFDPRTRTHGASLPVSYFSVNLVPWRDDSMLFLDEYTFGDEPLLRSAAGDPLPLPPALAASLADADAAAATTDGVVFYHSRSSPDDDERSLGVLLRVDHDGVLLSEEEVLYDRLVSEVVVLLPTRRSPMRCADSTPPGASSPKRRCESPTRTA